MASVAPRELKIGRIIDKTFAVIERCAAAALIYFVALTVIDGAIGYFALGVTAPLQAVAIALLKSAVGIVCAYPFIDVMVRRTGLRSRKEGDVYLAFFALSILSALGVFVGFILIIFPGLYIMARWSIAQPLIIARGGGPISALGESWERTEDNAFQILVAELVFLVPAIAISLFCTLMLGRTSITGTIISQLASSATSVLTLAMGVALLGLIVGVANAPADSRA